MRKRGKLLLRSSGVLLTIYALRIDPHIRALLKKMLVDQPDLTADQLQERLESVFLLEPITLGGLRSVLVYVDPGRVRSEDGTRRAWVGEARVGYRGSPVLWRIRPNDDLRFPYRGTPAKASVALRSFVYSMDLAPFAAEVEAELEPTRLALAQFAPTVSKFNPRIQKAIATIISHSGKTRPASKN